MNISELQQEFIIEDLMISHHGNPSDADADILPLDVDDGGHLGQVSNDDVVLINKPGNHHEPATVVLTLKAVVTIIATAGGVRSTIGITRHLEDLLAQTFQLELVSAELDPSKP